MEIKQVCGYQGHNEKLYDTEVEAQLSIKQAEFDDLQYELANVISNAYYINHKSELKIHYTLATLQGGYTTYNYMKDGKLQTFDQWYESQPRRYINEGISSYDIAKALSLNPTGIIELTFKAKEIYTELTELRLKVREIQAPQRHLLCNLTPKQGRRETIITRILKKLNLWT